MFMTPNVCGKLSALSTDNCPLLFPHDEDDNPHMSTMIHERIRQAIENKGLTLEAAAKLAKLDRGYFQKLFERENANPRADTLSKIANVLDVSEAWLMTGVEPRPLTPTQTSPIINLNSGLAPAPSFHPQDLPMDVEVLGTAAGSHGRGAFQLTGDVIDRVRRPPALFGATGVFALYVEGYSMAPQYNPGDLVYLNPNRPPRPGDIVVVQSQHHEHDGTEATIGIFMRQNEKSVVIKKHNPEATVEITRNKATKLFRVYTTNELFGV